ncbi:MAG: lipopolysaccharide kinase InaA family protein, partial [Desulfuromonadales bacterium]
MNTGARQPPAGNICQQGYERHGRFRVWRRGLGIDDALLAALLSDPDRVFARGETLPSPWQGPGTDKVRITLAGNNYFFKRYNPLGTFYGVKYRFRRSRAVKSWLAAQRFAQHGVPTPEPLLCLEERQGGSLGRSYLLFPFIAGETVSFLDLWPRLDDSQHRNSLAALGTIIGTMHGHGLLHGDLN